MKIRTRSTLLFTLIVGLILFIFSFAIYFLSENYRQNDFYIRLHERALARVKIILNPETNKSITHTTGAQGSNTHLTESILLLDQDFQPIYKDTSITIPSLDILNAIKNKKHYTYSIEDQEYLGFIYNEKSNKYLIIASGMDHYGKNYIDNLKKILTARMFVLIFVIFLSGWIYSGQLLKPISDIVKQADKVTDRNLNHRLIVGTPKDEIEQLATTFNKMLERLEISFNTQKRFVSNASHELRNPLTAIGGQIDVALLKDREINEYKTILTSISMDIKNLGVLTNNLLELANSDVETIFQNFEEIRIDEIVWSLREEFAKQKPEYVIHVIFENIADNENFLLCMGDERLLKTAFSNLITNACKFSQNKTVEIKVVFDKKRTTLLFEDAGIGIPKEHMKNLFERFSRGNNTNGIAGNGIGLSLVKRIITIHSGEISINSTLNVGTTVKVSLPNLSEY